MRAASAVSSGAVHSHRPCSGWTTMSGVPDPRSNIAARSGCAPECCRREPDPTALVPQRLSRLERVCDPRLRLWFAAQAQERFTLEIEQLLFGDGTFARRGAAGDDPRQLASDGRVVIGDAAGAPGEV